MSDIFGNLDNFIENYDEDDAASTSTLNDTQNSIATDSFENSRSIENRKGSDPKGKPTNRKSNVGGKKNQSSRSTTCTLDVGAGANVSTVTLAPAPQPLQSVVDRPQTIAGVVEEMSQLSRLFDSIFCSKNPIVIEILKSRNVSLIKRGYTTLCNSYHRKPPVTENDIKKIMKKIDASKCSLKQLEQSIQLLLSPISSNPFPPQTRRTRRSVQDNEAPVLAVISLDCDDDPTSSQPIFQSRYRRMSRRNGANGAGTQTNVISLDSDDENGGAAPLGQSSAANNSFESENYEMRIKVKWGRGIETFVHRRYQKFDDIIGQLAAKESADKGCIFFNLDDRIVYPSDTPDSINYKSHQFISGRILRTKALTLPASVGPSAGNSNMISLKIQMENRKQPLRLQIEKNQTMSVLVIKCAEELKCEPKAIRLYFDGELVDNGNKPEDLDLEGDEILDIRFVK